MKHKTDIRLVSFRGRLEDDAYNKQKEAIKPFKVLKRHPKDASWCGNIRATFENGVATLGKKFDTIDAEVDAASYRQISSHLALYRLISAFQSSPLTSQCDFYKVNWEYVLRHKKTGKLFILGEWKGGFQIFTPYHKASDLPKIYKKDAERLLTALVSDEWPIGYDGVLAGDVA